MILAALVISTAGTLAWIQYDRSLQTMTKLQIPILTIQGSAPGSLAMNLGDIDVESGNHQRTYVFGVSSNQPGHYKLQLAHTTNIPLTYTIYPATKEPGGNSDCTESGISFYYSSDAPLHGRYLNGAGGTPLVAQQNGTYHDLTYKTNTGAYPNVQLYAEPLYWQSNDPKSIEAGEQNTQFYVLEVTWGSGLKNDKETDMIYLTAFTGVT